MSLTSHAGNIYNPTQFTPPETYVSGNMADPGRVAWTRLYSLFLSDTMTFWHDRERCGRGVHVYPGWQAA